MTPSHPTTAAPGGATPLAADVRRLLDAQTSLPSRLGYTLLLLAGVGAAGVTGALLLTEVGLPLRTRVALAVIVGIGLAWAGFASWVLSCRRVLFATHRVVAARMAVGFSALFTLGAWAALHWGGTSLTGYAALGVGLAMFAVAVGLLYRARRHVAALVRRRAELERRLGVEEGSSR